MWYIIKAYSRFLRKATNQHGVHSPFVYTFVTKCLYRKTPEEAKKQLKAYRNKLRQSDEVIEVTDFGAGSRIFKSNRRAIKDIAKYAGARFARMKLLYRVVAYFKPNAILELGTSVGLATVSLALPKTGKVTSLEGCPQTAAVAQKHLNDAELTNVEVVVGNFKQTLPQVISEKFDLIYFDGNHSKEATLNYFEKLLPTAHNDSVWIFDDIYWSPEMTEAWELIKQHPRVSVTVDCFWLGFVFFRSEQVEEHFKIRL